MPADPGQSGEAPFAAPIPADGEIAAQASDPEAEGRGERGLCPALWRRLPAAWRPLLLLAPVALLLLLRAQQNSAPASSRRPAPLVETAAVQRGAIEVRQPVNAEIRPLVSVEVRPEVSGAIQQLFFQEGTVVRRGEPLALINPQPYRVALEQARANSARALARLGEARAQQRLAEAQMRLASDRARRYGGLSRMGALSRDDEESYRTEEQVARANLAAQRGAVASAAAEVSAARAAEAAARLDLGHTLLRAPITGRIGQQRISLGNLVRAQEERPLVVINQITPLDAVFAVPQRWQPQVQVGQTLRFEDRPGLRGRIVSLDNTTNAATGTVTAKARLSGSLDGLTPGESLEASLLLRRLEDVLLLPSRAVQPGQQGPFVMVARRGRAVVVPVKRLASDGDRSAVSGALQAGEAVVVAGQFALVPGGPLRSRGSVESGQAAPAADRERRGGPPPERPRP